ncbi:TPR repeat-containing protein, partial [Candidatus Gastranaerophilus sp. (ex Termes propinquus)]
MQSADDIKKILNEAAELISGKEFSKAAALLEKVYSHESDLNTEAQGEVLKSLGLCYVNLEKFHEALKVFEQITKLDEKDALAWFYLANCQEKTGYEDLAIESYRKVIALREEFWAGYKNLCALLLKQGRAEEVLPLMEKAVALNKSDYQFQYFLASAYMALKKYPEAICYLQEALALEPEHVQLLNNLGSSYLAIADWNSAEVYFKKSLELNSQNPSTNYNLGTLYQLKGDYDKAFKYFNESYKLEPNVANLSTLAYCAVQA